MSSTPKKLTYANYLQVDQLLGLQMPRSHPAEHDEMLFIVIHQVYELWFKQVLHELDLAGRKLREGDLWEVYHFLKRVRMVLKTLVGQVDILETMTPESFVSFRDRLDTASGFQSMQFRELEFKLGLKREEVLKYMPDGMAGREAAINRLNEPSLVDDFHVFLSNRGAAIPQEVLDRDVTLRSEPNEAVQDQLVDCSVNSPELANLFELMLDIDEGLQEWRYRHVQLVRRTIGNKHGTGGSPGVPYLERTLFEPVFPDLWAIRHRF